MYTHVSYWTLRQNVKKMLHMHIINSNDKLFAYDYLLINVCLYTYIKVIDDRITPDLSEKVKCKNICKHSYCLTSFR